MENENRLVLLLIRCVPAELKQNVLEKGDESEPMRAIALLEGILETLQPGGAAEMQSLQSFVRNLKPVNTAKEGLSVLRRWRLARSRAVALALPQVAPFEELGALGTLALNLEKRHDRLRTMLSLLRTRPEIIRPTPEGVDSMINLLDQQFQLLLADEHVKTGRRDRDDELDPSAKKGKGKDGKGKGKGKDSTSKDEKKECIVWKTLENASSAIGADLSTVASQQLLSRVLRRSPKHHLHRHLKLRNVLRGRRMANVDSEINVSMLM